MHVIRLRRPWQRCREDGSESMRIDVPEARDQSLGEFATLHYQRYFNLPSGLDPTSKVYLRIDGWEGRLESVSVNGFSVAVQPAKINADITPWLQLRNTITLRLAGISGQPSRLSGEVMLVIEENVESSNRSASGDGMHHH